MKFGRIETNLDHAELDDLIERDAFEKDRLACYWATHSVAGAMMWAEGFTEDFPSYLRVDVSKHDTATNLFIYLKMDGEEDLLIWRCEAWVSSGYSSGNSFGVVEGCEWAMTYVKWLITRSVDYVTKHNQSVELEEKRKADAELAEENRRINAFKEFYG